MDTGFELLSTEEPISSWGYVVFIVVSSNLPRGSGRALHR